MAASNTTTAKPTVDVSEEGLKKTRRWGLWINLGTFTIGYATSVISGALLYLKGDLSLSSSQQGIVTSIVLLGAMVAAFFTGRIADHFGRRAVLGTSGVLLAVGLAGSALSDSFAMLIVVRFVLGLGVGVASALVPTYLGEISPPAIRGRMLTLNQLMQTVGMLTAYVVNLVFASSGNWQAMFWVGVLPAVLLAVVATRLPDSPSWLVRTGRATAAHDLVESVAGSAQADTVIDSYQRDDAASRNAAEQQPGMRALMTPRVRPALMVGLGLAALQQFVGINTVLYYAPTIMQESGLSASNSIVYSVIIGFVNLAMTVVSLRLVDRTGRRPLLLASLIGMGISVTLLGFAFIGDLSSVVLLACMIVFVMSFAIGMGPVFWVILGEIFPSQQQAEGSGAGSSMNWLCNFAVSTAFLPLAGAIGTGQVFLVFAAICVLAFFFVYRYVPETKDLDFNHINADLQTRAHGEDSEEATAAAKLAV